MGQNYIYLEITEECNNTCRYCNDFRMSASGGEQRYNGESLSRGEIVGLMKKIQADIPLKNVAISGGEPTLRIDFPLILNDLVDLGLSPVVMTNGVGLTEELLGKLPRGVVFEVTLLGRNSQMHNFLAGRDVFDDIIRNVSVIEKYGSKLVVAFVATRANALEIYRVVELGLALGADSFVYRNVNSCSGKRQHISELAPSADMLRESLHLFQEAVSDFCVEAACPLSIPPCVVDVGSFPSIEFSWCPRSGGEARYSVDRTGLLKPCNHSSFVLGDLKREGFAEIVSCDSSRSFRQTIPAECTGCSHLPEESCRAGCMGASSAFDSSWNRTGSLCALSKSAT